MSHTDEKQPGTNNAARLLGAVGIVADVSAVVSLAHSQLQFIVTTGASVALLIGAYLFVRRWGRPVGLPVALSVLMMLAGTVVLTTTIHRSNQEGTSLLPGILPAPSATPYVATPPVKKTLGAIYDGKSKGGIRLTPDEGIDFEKNGAIIHHPNGPADPIDLILTTQYLDASTSYSLFYPFVGSTDATYDECTKLILDKKNSGNLSTNTYYNRYFTIGTQYCFQTSEGHTAWLKVVDSHLTGSAATDYLDILAYVWNQ